MYNLSDIRSIHFEITSKCQARCPMCPRRIKGGPLRPGMVLDEVDLKTFITWFPKDFIQQLNNLFMCGNLGDPLIAKDTLKIFKYLRQINPSISLEMHTNGSGRSKKWWKSHDIVINALDNVEARKYVDKCCNKYEGMGKRSSNCCRSCFFVSQRSHCSGCT